MRRLDKEPELYDLHTHLLGMGNTGFWINTILANHIIMPTNDEFRRDPDLRKKLCRLVWDKNNGEFLPGEKVDKIIQHLIDTDYPNRSLDTLQELIQIEISPAKTAFDSLLIKEEENKFLRELKDRNLAFQTGFSYDVVLILDDLANGLGVKNRGNEFVQAAIEEKLGFHMVSSSNRPQFRYWIIFNARKQNFEVVYGITVERLRSLIGIDANAPREANKLARAHIVNAFSMCDAQGTNARPIDFHGFHGMFTPEFYPRRFVLKDSIYSQRLDVLAHLLYYVLLRYDKCHPHVTYCELSVGVGDLTREWVFDVLCSFPTSEQKSVDRSTQTEDLSVQPPTTNLELSEEPSTTNSDNKRTFRKLVLDGHFPSLADAIKNDTESQSQLLSLVPKCTYKFLAGFSREKSKKPFLFGNQKEAIELLNEAPQVAIHLMLNEINKSARLEHITEETNIFYSHIQELKKVDEMATKNTSFHDWVVGFDFFGDEMGYPYCPFVARDFIEYVNKIRRKEKNGNPSFGLRIHCGENVHFADANNPTYRHFAAHMYIVFRCLRFIQHELEYGIRIGHGIAFQRILNGTMSTSKHRKSSVLLAEIKEHAKYVFKTIAFEVNITSNEYLLGHALRQGDYQRALQLDALLKFDAAIILATDDDGIWPIDNCPQNCPSHHSLSGEYCRAISSNIIQDTKVLEKIFKDMKQFRFYTADNVVVMPKADTSILPHDTRAPAVVIHPDIIKYIMGLYDPGDQKNGYFYEKFEKIYLQNSMEQTSNMSLSDNKLTIWQQTCRNLAPIAYVSYCAENSKGKCELSAEARDQYITIFKKSPNIDKVRIEWESVYQQLISTYTNVERLSAAQNRVSVSNFSESSTNDSTGSEEMQDQPNSALGEPLHVKKVLEELKRLYQQIIESFTVTERLSVAQNHLPALRALVCCAENFKENFQMNEEMRNPCNTTIDTTFDVTKVLEELKTLHRQLIESKGIGRSRCVSTSAGKDVFFSEESFTVHNDKTLPMKDLINYLKAHLHEGIRVHAFTRHINIHSTVSKINEVLKDPCHQDFHVYIYSNKDKEKYTDFELSNTIPLKINPTSSKRTDHNDIEQQNGLYAVCPHASAATAFLHLVSKELTSDVNIEPLTSVTDIPPPHTAKSGESNNTLIASSSPNHDNIQTSALVTDARSAPTTQIYHSNDLKRLHTDVDDGVHARKRHK
jgi:hypothetical protein